MWFPGIAAATRMCDQLSMIVGVAHLYLVRMAVMLHVIGMDGTRMSLDLSCSCIDHDCALMLGLMVGMADHERHNIVKCSKW